VVNYTLNADTDRIHMERVHPTGATLVLVLTHKVGGRYIPAMPGVPGSPATPSRWDHHEWDEPQFGWMYWNGLRLVQDEVIRFTTDMIYYNPDRSVDSNAYTFEKMFKIGPPKRRAPKSGANRDYQRSRVYAWENEHFGNQPLLDLDTIKDIVQSVWKDRYGSSVTPPSVGDGRRARRAKGGRSRVSFPRWSRQHWIVLHELAHSMCAYDRTCDHHGPKFVCRYIDLLVQYLNQSEGVLCRELADKRIDIA
jgi:hypothetical protein